VQCGQGIPVCEAHPWKANPEQIQLALRHVRAFLKANRPATAAEQPLAAAAQ
jgi:hypothetical protein